MNTEQICILARLSHYINVIGVVRIMYKSTTKDTRPLPNYVTPVSSFLTLNILNIFNSAFISNFKL